MNQCFVRPSVRPSVRPLLMDALTPTLRLRMAIHRNSTPLLPSRFIAETHGSIVVVAAAAAAAAAAVRQNAGNGVCAPPSAAVAATPRGRILKRLQGSLSAEVLPKTKMTH